MIVSYCGDTYHFNGAVFWVEGEQVVPNELSLLIEPFCFEDVAIFLDNSHIGVPECGMRLGHVLRHRHLF